MSRFVRQSAYRHVYGNPWKENYGNVRVSANAFDTNMVAVSPRYLSLNWQASGGGAFVVIPLEKHGKLPDLFPLVRAHTAPVLDTAWSPFDDSLVASAGEDGKVALTRVDESIIEAAFSSEGHDVRDLEPLSGTGASSKMGHGRKAGQVHFHPTANNVLASASYEVKLWDIEQMQARVEMEKQPDIVQNMSFDYTGSGLATTCKDKKLRIFDTRSGGAPHTVADSHSGVKASRVCWMGDLDRICTTGFSKMSDRQIFIWDTRNLSAPSKTVVIDTSSGTLMPFFSASNNILFFAGKGDGNVRYYEYEGDELYPLSEFKSSEPQRGMAFMPPRALNVHECEIARAYKVTNNAIDPISFIVPRKSDAFQSDIFPDAPSGEPALQADEFFNGKTAAPLLMNMENRSQAPVQAVRKPSTPVASSAPSPLHTRAPSRTTSTNVTSTSSAEPPKPTSTPIHPASSIVETGGSLPTPSSALSSAPQTPTSATTPASATSFSASNTLAKENSTPASGDSAEADSLRKENAKLKDELAERDGLIRKLELQVEAMQANAKIAREALAKY